MNGVDKNASMSKFFEINMISDMMKRNREGERCCWRRGKLCSCHAHEMGPYVANQNHT